MRAFITQVDWYKYTGLRKLLKELKLPRERGERLRPPEWSIANHAVADEIIYLLPRIRPQFAMLIVRQLRNVKGIEVLDALRTQDVIPLEYCDRINTNSFYAESVAIGFNLFSVPGNDKREPISKPLIAWTPGTHHLCPVRVKRGSMCLLLCLKRSGIALPRELRMHLIRIYAYADFLYQKCMARATHGAKDDVFTKWRLLENPIRTVRYPRESYQDMIIAIAHHHSTIDLMQNTSNFENSGSLQDRVRSAYTRGNHDEVLSLMGLKSIGYENFFVTMCRTKALNTLYSYCGHKSLRPSDIFFSLRNNTSLLCETTCKLLFDLSYKRNEWEWVRSMKWTELNGELFAYALERGCGWKLYSSVDEWIWAWEKWTPVLHANPLLYTLDFRYRARPFLGAKIGGVGAVIVKWMAYAVWIDHTVVMGSRKLKRRNMDYLARYTKHLPPKNILASELEKLVLEMQKLVQLYLAK